MTVKRKPAGSRSRMVSATLDLLRAGGLSSAGIHPVIAASKAPIGSLYHYFPGGKHELVAAALAEAEQAVGESFAAVFAGAAPIDEKVRVLFAVIIGVVAIGLAVILGTVGHFSHTVVHVAGYEIEIDDLGRPKIVCPSATSHPSPHAHSP